jgi:beta-galactosidase
VNSFGQGHAYYLATALAPEALTGFLRKLCADKAILPTLADAPTGLEVLPRVSPTGETLLYVLNHNAQPVTVPLPDGTYIDLLTEQKLSGNVELAGYGVWILAKDG